MNKNQSRCNTTKSKSKYRINRQIYNKTYIQFSTKNHTLTVTDQQREISNPSLQPR
jgi:hypothetical protein